MPNLKDLIRQYPELSDVFDRFESRIRYLELSHEPSFASMEAPPETIEPEPIPTGTDPKVWDKINEVKAEAHDTHMKLNDHLIESKKKSKGKKFTEYNT